jgi:hypothetical protein
MDALDLYAWLKFDYMSMLKLQLICDMIADDKEDMSSYFDEGFTVDFGRLGN